MLFKIELYILIVLYIEDYSINCWFCLIYMYFVFGNIKDNIFF